ncbi:glycosyltransferase [Paeniglutamicibacter gangotriensis]|uniref:Glycosyltransferase n=1 Tax=Paeniglutamicibacter gangotriensis TaxID=254787 RepID=A0A5B0EBQ9_9MICC|nr:glycosyltransferase [Paeniglutamicibacter gangotriensis]KAA0975291.1 glycosyltransferase [Paeniglutamicibacter gangotriensis]
MILSRLRRARSGAIRVSIVIPAYNCVDYITETVESAVTQELKSGVLEVIVVDDGSSDGTGEALDQLAGRHSVLQVLHQEPSGGPSRPRNKGLSLARGEYVFFLDADDVLTPGAMEGMADALERGGADVALGRFGSINGRNVPSQMFRETILDADLIDSNAWDSLGPIKMFRRSLLERLGARFAEDQWIGEDQPFTAAAYLNARHIAILADRDYVMVRKRDDGQNITSRQQTLDDKLKTASRLAAVIMEYTRPGTRRDRLMRRIFTSTLPSAVQRLVNTADAEAIERFAAGARESLADAYSPGVAAYCAHDLQVRYHLLLNAPIQMLLEFNRLVADSGTAIYAVQDGVLALCLPAEIKRHLPERLLADAGAIRPKTELLGIAGGPDGFTLTGRAALLGIDAPIGDLRLRVVERTTGEEHPVDVRITRQETLGATAWAWFSATVEPATGMGRGAWGPFLSVTTGDASEELRFGKKPGNIPDAKWSADWPATDMPPRAVAYFNANYKNLTFDVGGTVHRDPSAPRVTGMDVVVQDGVTYAGIQLSGLGPGQRAELQRPDGTGLGLAVPTGPGGATCWIAVPDAGHVALAPKAKVGKMVYAVSFDSLRSAQGHHLNVRMLKGGTAELALAWASNASGRLAARSGDVAVPYYWWEGRVNFGDAVGPWLAELMTGRSVDNIKRDKATKHGVVGVGSLLNHLDRPGLDVWGSGLIEPLDDETAGRLAERRPRAVHAVRGRLTAAELRTKLGWEVPEVFGDPALLLGRHYTPRPAAEPGGIALCLHYAHASKLGGALPGNVRTVDVAQTPDRVADAIAGASVCFSTSLHGLIVAQAYGVPWVWIKPPAGSLVGGEFKFRDFFSNFADPERVMSVELPAKGAAALDWDRLEREAVLPVLAADLDALEAAYPRLL